jgi:hypothetical protein
MDYDYNTSRKRLVLPEYGRNIQRMVDIAAATENREERNRLARGIIAVMGNLNPHLRDISDFKHKLWDHLAIISDFKLDIDSPYPMPTAEALSERPKSVPYNQEKIRFKHYGKIIEQMVKKAAEMEAGEEKSMLIALIANHMKKSYLTWNREVVSDEIIFSDLVEMSKGRLQIDANMRLPDTRDILSKNKKKKMQKKK